MQSTNARAIALAALLAVGAMLYVALGRTGVPQAPRWPESDAVYQAQSWIAGPQRVADGSNGTALVTRELTSPSGGRATLTVVVSRTPKVYAPGPEVPFLGTGYTVDRTPAAVVRTQGPDDGVAMLTASRGDEHWLAMYAYGEDRGLLGNGPLAWALALLDRSLGRPNDYYKLYLTARTDTASPEATHEIVELARTTFPRIAAWYAS
jgi:hypothetical protein